MYPLIPAESLTCTVQIGMVLASLMAAMFGFFVTRST